MSVIRHITTLTLCSFIAACGAEEQSVKAETTQQTVPEQASEVSQDELQQLKNRFSKLKIEVQEAQPSPVAGLYELTTNAGVFYSSLEGDYFLTGTLFSLDKEGNYVDLLAAKQQPLNAEKVEALADSMIVYKADNEKHVITVFTDITCGYCLKLHRELQDYLDKGITVRYLAYPRNGLQNQTAEEMAKIWCAEDNAQALHAAKVDRQSAEPIGDMAMCRATVAEHFNLGRELGISGTPAIILESGEIVGGYVDANQLLKIIEK
ncbi:bifunctional protein-disulfide isomerase/oxidoreductase DsbC [Vibrio maerlii]|uniref:bifunctional protein-disulfide isomerase/oxidoreductase DsbC n=1 Tax=Vibrio maerlii TaxID=2231648 RepID=UPI000E3DD4BF|nr:bifunctional protein-disulfide isomerase/oxidoreductase DsbC [Vibrio maerlii]